jgi:peroxiredoxin
MRKLVFGTALLALFLASCGGEKSGSNVSISGKITENGAKVYLNKFIDSLNRYVAIDSTNASGGSFTFKTYVDSTAFIILTHDNSDGVVELIVSKDQNISVSYNPLDLPLSLSVEGSENSILNTELTKVVAEFEQQKMAAKNKMDEMGYTDTVGRQNILREFEVVRAQFNQNKLRYFNEYPEELALQVFLPYLNYVDELPYIQKLESIYRKQLKGTTWHMYIANTLGKAENYIMQKERFEQQQKMQEELSTRLAIGSVAPDISLANPNGKDIALSDLRGKVVLLDFWASWCRPCRMENPNVVNLYHQYKSKGFTVYSVSLDNDKMRWESAIQQDGLVWDYHVSDLKGWNTSVGPLYGIQSIPQTFLLDKDGKIIATNLRGEALAQKLKEILG